MEEHLTSRRWGCREVKDIFDQINLLWNGILTENFVFNFKNSLYINAYDRLERKFKELTNHLKKIYDEWKSAKEVELKKLEEKAELRSMFCFLQASIVTDESEKEDNIHKDFEEFFNESEFSDILTTWKADKVVALKEKGKDIRRRTLMAIEKTIDDKIHMSELHAKTKDQKKIIITKAKACAVEYQHRGLGEQELWTEFEKLWQEWINDLKFPKSDNTIDFRSTCAKECILRKFSEQDEISIQKHLGQYGFGRRISLAPPDLLKRVYDLHREHIRGSVSTSDFEVVKEIKGELRGLEKKKKFLSRVREELRFFLCGTIEHIQQFQRESKEFTPDLLDNLFSKCLINDNIFGTEQERIVIHPDFKIKVVIHVFAYALKIFDAMQDRYERENSPREIVEKEKQTFWDIFDSAVRKVGYTITLSKIFLNVIQKGVCDKISDVLYEEMKSDIIQSNSDKTKFLVEVLEKLIDQDWEEFRDYLGNTKSLCKTLLKEKIEERYLSGENMHDIERVNVIVDDYTTTLSTLIESVWKEENTTEAELEKWLEIFQRKDTVVGFSESDFSTMKHISNTFEVEEFVSNVKQGMEMVKIELKEIFQDTINAFCTALSQEAFDEVWGCDFKCPFCKEYCRLGEGHVVDGKKHSCIQHRPEGIAGVHYKKSGIMDLRNCTEDVQGTATFAHGFINKYVGGKCPKKNCSKYHKYKSYQKYFPDWEIFPSTDVFGHSAYWYYMLNKYEKQLAEHYDIERPVIPSAWKNITKTEAKESLGRLST